MADAPPPAQIREVETVPALELESLYGSLGWEAYTRDLPGLTRAVANSTYVVEARIDGVLVGLARGLSDDVSIFYLQDILIRREHQRHGIGRELMRRCLERFSHVRTKMLLTDDLPGQHRFYEALGYVDTRGIDNPGLHAFIHMGADDPATD
ncbi:MAG: GNAT family N-acetyltransferase [Acidimicrobiia bacterium]|nr:GNAT family N-acetyltransferase [Acidimicrobiia bacterium]